MTHLLAPAMAPALATALDRCRGAAARERALFAPRPGHFSLVLLSVVAMSGWLGAACGPSVVVHPAPAAFAPVTAHVPADAPWALVTGPMELSDQQLAYELAAIAREPGLSHIFRDRFQALLGIDIFDAGDLARTGLDLRGDFALFGIGLQPAFLVRIRDRQRLNRFLEEVRAANPSLVLSNQVVEERTIHSVELASIHVSYTILDEIEGGPFLLGVYHDSRQDVTELFAPVLRSGRGLAPDLGHAEVFDAALGQLGEVSEWDTVLFVNSAAFDAGLLARAAPERDPALAMLSPSRRARFAEERRAWLSRCEHASQRLTDQVPWLVAGLRFDDGQFTQRVVVPVAAPVLDGLRSVLRPLGEHYPQLADEAIVSFAVNIDFAELPRVTSDRIELARCPNLAALEGIAAVLGTGLGRTDAAEVFDGPIYGALYAFDFNLSWFSQRSGAIVLAARDVETMLAGFELYFEGIGALDSGEDLDGTHYYGVFGGLLSVAVVPLEDHVALVLGTVDRERLEAALAEQPADDQGALAGELLAPPATSMAPQVPSRGELGRLDLDGARLRESLEGIIVQLSPSGLDVTVAESALEALGELSGALWRMRTEQGMVIIEGEWRQAPSAP